MGKVTECPNLKVHANFREIWAFCDYSRKDSNKTLREKSQGLISRKLACMLAFCECRLTSLALALSGIVSLSMVSSLVSFTLVSLSLIAHASVALP